MTIESNAPGRTDQSTSVLLESKRNHIVLTWVTGRTLRAHTLVAGELPMSTDPLFEKIHAVAQRTRHSL